MSHDTTTPLSEPTHRTSGRRQRGASPPSALCDASATVKSRTLADAKSKFAATVSRGISVLMNECGYSRERAAATLLREIAGGDITPPGDKEIFQAMSTLGIGIEDAARALAVSKAIERETTQRNVSVLEAIDELTSKLTNLIHRGSQSLSNKHIPCDDENMPHRTAEIRIQPVPTLSVPRPASAPASIEFNSATSGRKIKSINNKTSKQKNGNGNRKRPAEDIAASNRLDHPSTSKLETPTESFPTRNRSDSLSEVVSAKFGDGKLEDAAPTIRSTSLTSPGAVRAKRGRVDDGESAHSALKRSRANSD